MAPGKRAPRTSAGSESPVPAPGGGAKLSTFEGVFTPSILTILGVIMYLRTGWVVGNVGLTGAFVVVTLSTGITFLTALSISEIATDRVVRVGGAYYMISRALGLETGGAIGIPLYFAQALSVALYTVGFAESFVAVFPALSQRWVAIVVTVLVALLALRSARIAIRSQYFIMAGIVVSLVSFVFGGPVEQTVTMQEVEPVGFWAVFAVFFPAVTGIMAGVNMSGDLENPSQAIPRGTLAAVGTGYVIYMTIPLLLWMWAPRAELIDDPLIMRRMAFWGDAILVGVWGATLSSAVGSILGAPRVLQALARDGVLPRWLRFLGGGSGEADEPRIGTVVTLGVALAAVGTGNLNLIAPVLTMFFLTTYMVLNLAAGIERLLDSPSFRPAFRVHWSLSLAGAVGCGAVMFLINPLATLVAASVILMTYVWLERRELEAAWGDVRLGIWMAIMRAGLFHADERPDPRNWRPHLLVLSGAPTKRWHLVELGSGLTHNRGLVTVASILPEGSRDASRQADLEKTVRDFLARRGIHCMVRVVTAPDPFAGARTLIEAYGLGPVVPNTVLMGDSERAETRQQYCELIATIHENRRNVLVLRNPENRGFGDRRRIDLWWGGLHYNGGLMLLLAYLLKTGAWRAAELNLNLVVNDEGGAQQARENLNRVVSGLRIGAIPRVLVSNRRPFGEVLRETSVGADLVIMGMAEPEDGFVEYYEHLQRITAAMPPTMVVLAAEDLAFSEVLTER